MNTYLNRLAGIIVMTIATSLSPAIAQDYPTRLIHLIVPYSAGGSTDFVARLYAKKLSERLGQAVVVDNRPGASTNIGSDVVARSTPDGYTLLFSDGAYIWNSVFGPVPPFDALTGLIPVGLVANTPFVVAANPKTKFSTMKGLIAAAKLAPGKYTISSASLRTFVELMNSRAGMKLLHIPYKGGAAATTDAIAGQVNLVYAALPVLLPFIQSGKLKPLAVTSLKRSPALASVPSLSELGVDYDISIQYVVFVPAKTSALIQARLAQATEKVTSDKDFSKKLLVAGSEAVTMPPDELRAKVRRELTMWRQVAKDLPDLVNADPSHPK